MWLNCSSQASPGRWDHVRNVHLTKNRLRLVRATGVNICDTQGSVCNCTISIWDCTKWGWGSAKVRSWWSQHWGWWGWVICLIVLDGFEDTFVDVEAGFPSMDRDAEV